MTLSPKMRLDYQRTLLAMFVDRIEDGYYFGEFVGPHTPDFSDFPATTWRELQDGYYLDSARTFGHTEYALTAEGWLKGLELLGRLESPETRQRGVALARALKGQIDRSSHHEMIADERELAPQLGIAQGWIYNALASNLLNALFPNDNMTIRRDIVGRCFRIPPTFGMDWIDAL